MNDEVFERLGRTDEQRREIGLRLDGEGRFWHQDTIIENPKLVRALHRWITRNPEDGRYVVSNGYDWVYLHVDDVPFFVRSIAIEPGGRITLKLSDESEEPLDPDTVRVGEGGAVYVKVRGGDFEAKFTRHAQTSLAPALVEQADGTVALRVGGRLVPVG